MGNDGGGVGEVAAEVFGVCVGGVLQSLMLGRWCW